MSQKEIERLCLSVLCNTEGACTCVEDQTDFREHETGCLTLFVWVEPTSSQEFDTHQTARTAFEFPRKM